ncbi:hypothetical protein [Clostridium tetani]|uniref:hypothetical protein n=1 Tax=Clostridium tetani TaxID=1513 RepID=UPI00100B078C|nr:hypothetical protein [Clostridium tetani]
MRSSIQIKNFGRINDHRPSRLTAVQWTRDHVIAVHKLRYYINKFNKENKQSQGIESQKVKRASIIPGYTL